MAQVYEQPAPKRQRIGFRKVLTSSPEVKELQDSILTMVGELNALLSANYALMLPIGTPVPFLVNLFPEGFTLGEKFLPMDGRVVVNRASPLHGQTLTPPTTDLGVGATWYVRVVD